MAAREGSRRALHQGGRRVVADEEHRQLARHELRRRGRGHDAVQRLVHRRHALGPQRLAQQDLGRIVVPLGVELEKAIAQVIGLQRRGHPGRRRIGIAGAETHARQHMGHGLHIGLGVAAAHAHGVQLQKLAGVVFVDVALGVAGVVQVEQHRRVAHARFEQRAEVAQGVGADRPLLVITNPQPGFGLARADIEVVHPEPGHLLLQLGR